MEYLEKYGIPNNIIEEIRMKYDEIVIENMRIEQWNVEKVIQYFQEIGIIPINEIILNHPNIFLKDINQVMKAFKKYKIKEIVDKINIDSNTIIKV